MPRKILNDDYILNKCPQYQPLGVPNALLPQVDKPPKLQGFKNVVPPRPTSISATISDLANNVYTPVPLNSKQKAENLMKAQQRVSEQMAVEVDPLALDDVNELRAIALSLQSDIEEGVIRGDEELKEALRLSGQEARATVQVQELEEKMTEFVPKIRKSKIPIEQTILQRLNIPAPTKEQLIKGLGRRIPIEEVDIASPAEERVRMALEDMPIPRSVKNPVFEKNFKEMEERIKSSEERVRMSLEDMPVRREIILPVSEEEEKVEVEVEEEPEEAEEMAGDRLAPRAVIKTKELQVRPEVLRKFEEAEQIIKEFGEEPLKESRRPRRVGLRGSMRGELR